MYVEDTISLSYIANFGHLVVFQLYSFFFIEVKFYDVNFLNSIVPGFPDMLRMTFPTSR